EIVSPDGLDTNTSVWNYTVTKPSLGVVTSMAVTDPLNNKTTSTLDQSTGLLTQTQLADSTNTVLRTIGYLWTTSGNGTVPSKITTVLNDTGQSSFIQYAYDASYGNVTDIYEYDFGNILKRHTVTTYQNNPTYHILGLPTQILVKDGSDNIIARTD